jgi:hypothetical protein
VIPENAGGKQVKDVFGAFGDDGVAGVVAALAADDDIGGLGEVVNDFAFAFVAPLEAGDNSVHEFQIFNRK